ETEHDNLRAALGWGLATAGDRDAGLQLAVAMAGFWSAGNLNEGREWLGRLVAGGGRASPALRKRALHERGDRARQQSGYAEAQSFGEEGLAIRRRLGNDAEIARRVSLLGELASYQGDYPRARALFEEHLALQKEIGGDGEIARALWALGGVALAQENLAE